MISAVKPQGLNLGSTNVSSAIILREHLASVETLSLWITQSLFEVGMRFSSDSYISPPVAWWKLTPLKFPEPNHTIMN